MLENKMWLPNYTCGTGKPHKRNSLTTQVEQENPTKY